MLILCCKLLQSLVSNNIAKRLTVFPQMKYNTREKAQWKFNIFEKKGWILKKEKWTFAYKLHKP